MTEGDDLKERIHRLERELDAARTQADQWREVAEERRVVLERLRQHPVVRVLFRLRRVLAPLMRLARVVARRRRRAARVARRMGGAARAVAAQRGVRRRRAALDRMVAELDRRPARPPAAPTSVIILTRDGGPDLRSLLATVAETGAEVVVVDNGGGHVARRLRDWEGPGHVVTVLDPPRDFGSANNAGAQVASGDVLCFLNDDVVPLTRGWLADLVDQLVDDRATAAGAQLLYAPQRAMARRHGDYTVQHLGIEYVPRGAGVPSPRNRTAPEVVSGPPTAVPAVTAACLAVSRRRFDAVGGFADVYEFGAEDVDLARRLAGGRGQVVVVPSAVLLHHEGATRLSDDDRLRHDRQARNWRSFEGRLGPALWHEVAVDRVRGELRLTSTPLRVAITVTRDDPEVAYGDLATARALRDRFVGLGWGVVFVERYRDGWYELPDDIDVVLVLLDTYDVRRVARPGLTIVAWARNWEARWAGHPWAGSYDLVLTSGDPDAVRDAFAELGVPLGRLPLATDPDRFVDTGEARKGIVLPVHHWGEDRGVPELVAAVPELRVVGKDWDAVPSVRPAWDGPVPPDQMPDLYARAEVVVDVAAIHTRDAGSVNARVFDALAAGAVVVSDQPGVHDLFDGDVPVFGNAQELASLLAAHAADPAPLRAAAARARDRVLEDHTWARRCEALRGHLDYLAAMPRLAILTGAPEGEAGRTWGDTHLAEALARAVRPLGLRPTVVPRPGWDDSLVRAADVTVHLKGRGRAPVHPGQANVLWVISHPEELADDELDAVDLVLAGSRRLAEHLRDRTGTPVAVLRQATDHLRFRPGRARGERRPVVFVGNSRFADRPVVQAAAAAGLDLVVHGANWDRHLPPSVLGRRYVPNEELAAVYAGADVVLNDHWPVMRRWGLISNRLFDALAAGACVVTDRVDELDECLGDGVVVVDDPGEVGEVVRALLADSERRATVAASGRARVLAEHTFDHRARQLVGLLSEHGLGRPVPPVDPLPVTTRP